ncbi:MAG: hypothetical protein CSA20_05250 [Deltaproteobacteria bacterium]|nr:MAG: hypothetical protein CSA20_05250 [Deltaproteobacteria bacterium]
MVYPVDSQFPEMMFLGRVLDERYFLDDVKNAIQQQIGLSADNDATLVSINGKSSYDYIEYYKFQLYGKYIELSVYIRGVRDSIGGPSVTTIDYRFEDVTRSVDKCIKRKKSDQRIKEKGKTIRLD